MAQSITVFDITSGKTKVITLDIAQTVLNQDMGPGGLGTGWIDTYLKLTVTANMVNGSPVSAQVITGDSDLVLGTTQYDGITTSPYDGLGEAVNDYVLRMVHGIPGQTGTPMNFNS